MEKIIIEEATRLADGDLVVTFSDGTLVLYHAEFLYRVRNDDQNLEIVNPFEQ